MSTVQRVRSRSVSGSELESLGKQASRLGQTSGLSLTEACVRTLEGQDLNAEQIRRAVEHCNINAVNSKFASLRGSDRVVHIDGGPADPVMVMDALHATSTAKEAQLVALEYSAAPRYEKRAVRLPDAPRPNLPKLAHKLEQAHDELVDLCAGLEFRMEEKLAELRTSAIRASNEGATLRDLASAWSCLHSKVAQVAAQSLRDDIAWSVGKTAARSIRPDADVMQKFAAFSAIALEYGRAVEARRTVETELARVAPFLDAQVS